MAPGPQGRRARSRCRRDRPVRFAPRRRCFIRHGPSRLPPRWTVSAPKSSIAPGTTPHPAMRRRMSRPAPRQRLRQALGFRSPALSPPPRPPAQGRRQGRWGPWTGRRRGLGTSMSMSPGRPRRRSLMPLTPTVPPKLVNWPRRSRLRLYGRPRHLARKSRRALMSVTRRLPVLPARRRRPFCRPSARPVMTGPGTMWRLRGELRLSRFVLRSGPMTSCRPVRTGRRVP